MTSLQFVFLVFGAVAVSLGSVSALSDEDRTKIYAAMIPFVTECSKEFGVSEDQIKSAKESGDVGGINPCLVDCIFKKTKMLNSEGLLDVAKTEELSKKYLSEEADQQKSAEIIKTCSSVNDQEVSEGDKECKRAKLLLECLKPFKGDFIKTR